MTGTPNQNKEKRQAKKAMNREVRRLAKEKLKSMEITRTRNVAARKVLDNAIVKQKKPRINWFLVELLDPSRWEEALAHGLRGIPDFYSHRNHVFCTKTVLQLGPTNFGADGKCNIIVNPTLDDHVGHNNVSTERVTFSAGAAKVVGNAVTFHHIDGSGGYVAPSVPAPQQRVQASGTTVRFFLPSSMKCAGSDGNNGPCRQLFPIKDSSTFSDGDFGDFKYQITPAADNFVTLSVYLDLPVSGTVTVEVDTDLALRSASYIATTQTAFALSLTLNALDSEIRAVRLLNSTGASLTLSGMRLSMSVHPSADYKNMYFEVAQNYERIKADFTAVRPICGYLWPKYRGDLTKSGNLTGALIDAGSTPTLARATEYDDVAGLLHSYEGNAVEGGYGIWCPMNPADNNFTAIDDPRPMAPFLICCLDVDDVAAQNFRVEVFFVWEGLTQLQMYSPEAGSVDIMMMNDAFEKLAHFDKFMANDSHLKTISRFLSNSFNKGKNAFNEYASTPEGKAGLMSAAKFLVSKASAYGPVVANMARIALQAAASA